MSKSYKLVFEFPSVETREEFVSWLCGSGEQHYWDWCFCIDDRPAVVFDYWKGTLDGENFVGYSNRKTIIISTENYYKE